MRSKQRKVVLDAEEEAATTAAATPVNEPPPPTYGLRDLEHLTYTEGRQVLKELLLKATKDDKEDLREDCEMDFIYSLIRHLYCRGIEWLEIEHIFEEELNRIIEGFIASTNEKAFFIAFVNDIINQSCLTENAVKAIIEFSRLTFIQHFNLHKFCRLQERQDESRRFKLQIEQTGEIPLLKASKEKKIADYEYQLSQIESKWKEQVNVEKAEFAKAAEMKRNQEKELFDVDNSIKHDEISDVIDKALSTYLDSTAFSIKHDVRMSVSELIRMTERNLLPRPIALGNPARYPLKMPLKKGGTVIHEVAAATNKTPSAKQRHLSSHNNYDKKLK